MAKKPVDFTDTFKQNYQRMPFSIQKRFDEKLKLFMENPMHPSLNIHRYNEIWEGYVTSKYRFTFSSTKEAYLFRNIGPHGIIDKGKV
ncbi:MAG: hypothetical protein HYS07_01745 [Chlamydiae bacterium]|nr:hypothetical protein [Chlamydiota bacterium]MBI3277284.1 hypothetical protein [Chlamydiota bacterium]